MPLPRKLRRTACGISVRILSLLRPDEHGDIQPTHILNVTTEESYDLYENRFVYHLIRRLFAIC